MNDLKARVILNIHKFSSEGEIKNAYKKLALKYHPDKNSSNDAKKKFQDISNAYRYLMKNNKDVKEEDDDLNISLDLFYSIFPYIKKSFVKTCTYIIENGINPDYFNDILSFYGISKNCITIYLKCLWYYTMYNSYLRDIDVEVTLEECYNHIFISKKIILPFFDSNNKFFSIQTILIIDCISCTILCSPLDKSIAKNKEFMDVLKNITFNVSIESEEKHMIIDDFDIYCTSETGKILKISKTIINIEKKIKTRNGQWFLMKGKGLFCNKKKNRGDLYLRVF